MGSSYSPDFKHWTFTMRLFSVISGKSLRGKVQRCSWYILKLQLTGLRASWVLYYITSDSGMPLLETSQMWGTIYCNYSLVYHGQRSCRFPSMGKKICLKKTICIRYGLYAVWNLFFIFTQAWAPVSNHGNWWEISRLDGIQKSDKTNKKSKRLQLQRETEEIRNIYFTRKKNKIWFNGNFQNNYWNF